MAFICYTSNLYLKCDNDSCSGMVSYRSKVYNSDKIDITTVFSKYITIYLFCLQAAAAALYVIHHHRALTQHRVALPASLGLLG